MSVIVSSSKTTVGGKWGQPKQVTLDTNGIAVLSGAGYYQIGTFGGAASDDLVQITGLNVGDEIILEAADDAHTVVVKDNANLNLTGIDFSLNTVRDKIMLLCIAVGICDELMRSSND
uniref:Uncharacterized protein n=1 Tax=viral metagenome TaxID=1070528 RepID=A0A6M3M9Z5_9ZZZZ